MTINKAKIIEILDPGPLGQKIKETEMDVNAGSQVDLAEYNIFENKSGMRMSLREVAANTTSQFPALLRDGLRPILFDTYAGFQTTWQLFCDTMPSDKPFEDWLEMNQPGLAPIVAEGDQYPRIDLQLDRTKQIRNDKRGFILPITREMILYDRIGMIRQGISALGPALARTKEQAAYNVITTAGNYTRTTADNEVGNNTAGTAFSATGLITALDTIRTMWDQKSKVPLGCYADTLICGPQLEWYAKELLLGDVLWRQGGSTTNEKFGTSPENVFKSVIKQIIVSPFVQTNAWVLMAAKRAVMMQQVWGPELLQATATGDNWTYMQMDVLEYRADENFGVDMLNDRFAYYSTGGTPVVT